MQTRDWLTIAGFGVSIFIAFFLAYKKGELKKIGIYVNPCQMKTSLKNSRLFQFKRVKLPAIGIINFFMLPVSNHRRICFHIYFTVENLSVHAIDDLKVTFVYPRRYQDEFDTDFWKAAGTKNSVDFTIVYPDNNTIQVTYTFASVHPKAIRQICHPMLISLEDCVTPLHVNSPILFYASPVRNYSAFPIPYLITGKNLKKPVNGYFWLINVLSSNYKQFFNREKKMLHEISRQFNLPRYVFEIRNIVQYQEGKRKKDVLVVLADQLNISYSHFPPLKEPEGGFNFEQDDREL
jgi:hypothetical protein